MARSQALERGLVDECSADPTELLPGADYLILAAPIRAIIGLLYDLPHIHPGQAMAIDLGSTKVEITNAMQALPERFEPIGGHPMCGKEAGTLVNADPQLFHGAPFALTAIPQTTNRARLAANELVRTLGARPVWLDAESHDRWVAATSHLPYLVANALAFSTPIESAPLVGSGFRSTTRLAPSPRRMMLDVLITNQRYILAGLRDYRQHPSLNNIRIAPRKTRLTAELVRGLGVEDAVDQLEPSVKKTSSHMRKLLKSAVSNAENNLGLDKDNLYVFDVIMVAGPTLKSGCPELSAEPEEYLSEHLKSR